jgi:hypothetical protein
LAQDVSESLFKRGDLKVCVYVSAHVIVHEVALGPIPKQVAESESKVLVVQMDGT